MQAQKPFWKTTPGILAGCFALIIVLILLACACFAVLYAMGTFGELGDLTSPTPIVKLPTLPAPPPPTVPTLQEIVTNVVMARGVQANTFEPVDITNAFPADQAVFHAVVTIVDAPANTTFKVIWLTGTNTKMGEFELPAQGSRNLNFTFRPDGGKLPQGNYKVEIYVNNRLDRTLNFAVTGQAAPPPATKPQVKPSGFVASITMAEDTQGANKDPVNLTEVFKPTSTFHAVVRTQNAPANTKFSAAWYAVDVGTAAPPNTLIDQTDVTTDGSRNIDFTLRPTTAWPLGTYRVEVSVNGVLDSVKNFSVK